MSDLPVTLGDLIVIGVLLLSGLLALFRGFVQEVLDVGAWIGAIAAAVYGYPMLAPYLADTISDTRIANVAAGGIIFLGAIVILSIVTRLISGLVRSSQLGAVDRSLGFLFGLARGWVIVVLLFLGMDFLVKPEDRPEWITQAKTFDAVSSGAAYARTLVPDSVMDQGRTVATDARDTSNDLLEAERMFRQMISPDPKSEATSAAAPDGYLAKQRQDMERLLESSPQGQQIKQMMQDPQQRQELKRLIESSPEGEAFQRVLQSETGGN